MLTLEQEYNQWLENYEMLLMELKWAFYYKNKDAIKDLNERIINTQVQIAICARELKKQRYSDPSYAVSSPIPRHVQVAEYPSMDFNGPDGLPPDWLG